MIEQVISAFLERGLFGLLAVAALIIAWHKDKQLLSLNQRYTEQLVASAGLNAKLASDVAGAVKELNETCEECPYRRFMEDLGGGG